MKPLEINQIHQGDCRKLLQQIAAESVDLVFADPPFNIGYKYDVYDDRRKADEYLEWSRDWIRGVANVLKPDGTFWLAIGDEFAAELKLIAQNDAGLHCRSWVIWYYTFGVNCTRGFSRSHTHLFHFVKDKQKFTFNSENPAVRIPSARQLVYADARANPKGRLPDNTWILRPQDAPQSFTPDHDTWYFPRIAGTFKEREGFHGCQMPEQLLGRIIRLCSNPGEVVLDPFGGSGTTLATAKKLGRQWIGLELSSEYVSHVKRRLDAAHPGDPLDGVADPLSSAPATHLGNRRKRTAKARDTSKAPGSPYWLSEIADVFELTRESLSVDQLLARPDANSRFVKECRRRKLEGDATRWNQALINLRKRGSLSKASQKPAPAFTPEQLDRVTHAAEIAWHYSLVEYKLSLDGVLCNPGVAEYFDALAERLAPGYEPFRYRWAAITLRKRQRASQRLAETEFEEWLGKRLPRSIPWTDILQKTPSAPGAYVLQTGDKLPLYIGETRDLKRRFADMMDTDYWQQMGIKSVRIVECESQPWGLQAALVSRLGSLLNMRVETKDASQTQEPATAEIGV